jgi:hypothetical protein
MGKAKERRKSPDQLGHGSRLPQWGRRHQAPRRKPGSSALLRRACTARVIASAVARADAACAGPGLGAWRLLGPARSSRLPRPMPRRSQAPASSCRPSTHHPRRLRRLPHPRIRVRARARSRGTGRRVAASMRLGARQRAHAAGRGPGRSGSDRLASGDGRPAAPRVRKRPAPRSACGARVEPVPAGPGPGARPSPCCPPAKGRP